MRQIICIDSAEAIEEAVAIIQSIGEGYDVIVEEHKEGRSLPQNALYWEWIGIIAKYCGTTKYEQHEMFKEQHLMPIFARDDMDYADLIELIREEWRRGNKSRAERLYEKLKRMTSTTKTSKRQMAEYMTQVQIAATGIGLVLPTKEDLENEQRNGRQNSSLYSSQSTRT